jgi:hypothetical protein
VEHLTRYVIAQGLMGPLLVVEGQISADSGSGLRPVLIRHFPFGRASGLDRSRNRMAPVYDGICVSGNLFRPKVEATISAVDNPPVLLHRHPS